MRQLKDRRNIAGTLKLVGTDEEVIYKSFKQLLEIKEYEKMSHASNPMVMVLLVGESQMC